MSVTISGSGQIIKQVVQATLASPVSTTSSSFVTTGLSASITPTNSSNKILIMVMGNGYNTAGQAQYTTIYRGATDIGNTANLGLAKLYGGAASIWTGTPITYMDSPATTSATTYTVYFRCVSGTSYFGDSGGAGPVGAILLMEVAYA